MSVALSIAAIAVSLVSVGISVLAKRSADRSADAAESSDRREREPRLAVVLDSPAPGNADRAIYRLRNDGPQDLDSVVMHQPEALDRIIYAIAVSGATDWAEEIDLGPLPVTVERRFTLSCGPGVLPEFRVRIECRAGADTWTLAALLPDPRGDDPQAPISS